MVYSFLDTNMLLHYPLPDQVDWPDIIATSEVTIVIAPVVFRELNRHKDKPESRRLRDRAAKALKWFDPFVDNPTRPLRANVGLLLLPGDPTLDFGKYRLSRDLNDDWLLASILEFQISKPASKTVLVTEDRGLKVKAVGQGLEVVRLHETLRLPDEPDETEKKLRETEDELRRLRNAIPDLKLAFEDGSDHIRVAVPLPVKNTAEQISARMAEVRKEYPKKQEPVRFGSSSLTQLSAALGNVTLGNYNQRMETFYTDYEQYLKELNQLEDKKAKTFILKLRLSNIGSCPATDVHVFLHFPDGIAVYEKDCFEDALIEPVVPSAPVEGFSAGTAALAEPWSLVPPRMPAIDSPFANVSGWSVKRSNSYDVSGHVKELTHGLAVDLDGLYVMFESREAIRSFSIDYELLAGNIPTKLTEKLHVIVES